MKSCVDRHGVFQIVGRDPAEVAHEFGRMQAVYQSEGLFRALARAAGRVTELVGPAHARARGRVLDHDPHVVSDLEARRHRFADHGRRLLAGLSPEVRLWVDHFAKGVEHARRTLRVDLDPAHALLHRLLSLRVCPSLITALDYCIASHHELCRLRWEDVRPAPTASPRSSNAVAVGGRRVQGGGGLLLIDPHIPFRAIPELRLVLARIHAPGYVAAGLVRLGSPFVFLGFSRHVAWTVTTNWPDTIRFVRLRRRGERFVDLDSGRFVARRVREAEVAVLDQGPRRFELVYAGAWNRPVVQSMGRGTWLAAELAAAGSRVRGAAFISGPGGDLSTQLFTAAQVRTARAFQRRVLAVPGASLTNFIVADRKGGIGCFWHGRVPRHGGGFLDSVRDMPFDHGGPDGLLVQNNVHFDRVRPGQGGARLDAFPPRVARGPVSLSTFRQERTLGWLNRHPRISLEHLTRLALDTHDLRGALFVRRMREAIRASGMVARWSRARKRRLTRDLGEIARWNRRLDVGSRRATLVMLWMELTFFAAPDLAHAFNRPQTVPERVPARLAGPAARALLDAGERWRAAGRPAWGQVHRLRLGFDAWPVGGSGHVNRAASWLSPPDLDPGTLDFPVEAGSSGVIVVHLRPSGARARFLKVTGPAEDPSSPLHTVHARDWARARFRPLELDPGRGDG